MFTKWLDTRYHLRSICPRHLLEIKTRESSEKQCTLRGCVAVELADLPITVRIDKYTKKSVIFVHYNTAVEQQNYIKNLAQARLAVDRPYNAYSKNLEEKTN